MKTLKEFLLDAFFGGMGAFIIGTGIIATTEYINGSYGFFKSHGPIIIGVFVLATWWTIIHAKYEAKKVVQLKKGEKLNHTVRFWYRFAIAYCIGLFIHLYGEGVTTQAFTMALACAGFIGGIFWMFFDPSINLFIGEPAFRIPEADYDGASKSDKFFSKHHIGFWLASKVILFLITLYLYNQSFKWFSYGSRLF
jgi:hypothetical protein